MILRRRGADVLVRAPAKVNLFLEVLRRRDDGYHELATLMTAVSVYDTLRFRDDPSGSVRLRCDRPDLSAGPDNLICRAAELLRRRAGRDLGADVRLWKRIPMAGRTGRRLQRRRRRPRRAERPVAAGTDRGRTRRPRGRAGQRRAVFLRRPRRLVYGPRRKSRSRRPGPAARFRAGFSAGRTVHRGGVSERRRRRPEPLIRRGSPPGRRGRRRGGARPAAAQPLAGPGRTAPSPKRRSGGNGWPPWGRPAA